MSDVKVVAIKRPDGRFGLSLEIPKIQLPVVYGIEDLETLEKNGVLNNRNSYNAGTTLEFYLADEDGARITTAILKAVTEG